MPAKQTHLTTLDTLFQAKALKEKIIFRLSVMETCLKWHSKRGENDLCKAAEDVVAHFLTALCGWELINLNTIKANYPVVDLGDTKRRIGVQVTVNNTLEKAKDVHSGAITHTMATHFDEIIILFLTEVAPNEPKNSKNFTCCTKPSITLWARPEINRRLDGLTIPQLEEVLRVLEEQMPAIGAVLWPTLDYRPQNLPYPTLGSLFKGRDEFLHSLRQKLHSAKPAVIHARQAIHGMGGVGKTRAAVEYAWSYAYDYRALLFVAADTPDSLQRNLAALCATLDLPEQDATETAVQLSAVLNHLQKKPDWLLIIDNVDTEDSQAAVCELLASLPHGHILITSRLADWPPEVISLDLDVLSVESSVEFLLERTEGRRIPLANDEDLVIEIARHLDRLALALEQAAAYIRARCCTFQDFLNDWESKRANVLAWYDPKKMHYPRSVAITYQTSLSQLTAPAQELFRILSWLAPDPMPLKHLEHLSALPDARSHLIALTDLHLATLNPQDQTFSVHRLLQEISRQQQARRGWFKLLLDKLFKRPPQHPALILALEWINQEMPTETYDVRTWRITIPLAAHAVDVSHFAAARQIPAPTTRLLACVAVLFKTQANFQAAELLFRLSLEIETQYLGENNPRLAIPFNNLATLLQATNRLAEAEPLMRRALAIDEASFGPDHPTVGIRLNNLATLLQATNRLPEAEPLIRRSLVIDEASFGPDHPNVAIRLNNLAQLLKDTNRLDEAESMLKEALRIVGTWRDAYDC